MDTFVTACLRTVAFFDAFDRPLTREELYRLLWQKKMNYTDFLLQTEQLPETVRTQGFFHLPDRASIVNTHQQRVRLVEEKTAIARRAVKKMRWIPFVRAVYLCNTVAFGCPKETSDVDVFIVIQNGRLWLTRLLVTLILSLFRLRRNKKEVADKICLSFYAVDTALDLGKIRSVPDDIYLAYWIAHLLPLFDPDNLLEEIEEKNTWVKEYLPNILLQKTILTTRSVSDLLCIRVCRKTGERFLSGILGQWFENLARRVQKMKMNKNTVSVQNEPDTRVIVSDEMLKFHENDRRGYYREEWLRKCNEHNILTS